MALLIGNMGIQACFYKTLPMSNHYPKSFLFKKFAVYGVTLASYVVKYVFPCANMYIYKYMHTLPMSLSCCVVNNELNVVSATRFSSATNRFA